jgi:hypothetical protein
VEQAQLLEADTEYLEHAQAAAAALFRLQTIAGHLKRHDALDSRAYNPAARDVYLPPFGPSSLAAAKEACTAPESSNEWFGHNVFRYPDWDAARRAFEQELAALV